MTPAAAAAGIEKAETRSEIPYGIRRSADEKIIAGTPPKKTGLQVLGYGLWALQRYCERGEPRYVGPIWHKLSRSMTSIARRAAARVSSTTGVALLIPDQGATDDGLWSADPLTETSVVRLKSLTYRCAECPLHNRSTSPHGQTRYY